jgi:hypothetical protein
MRDRNVARRQSLLNPVLIPSIAPWLFLIGLVLFAVLGNSVYELLKLLFPSPLAIGIITIIAISALLVIYRILRRYWRPTLDSSLSMHPRRGLVVLVSPGKLEDSAALGAIRYHFRGERDERGLPTLEHCWLVTSPEEPPAKEDVLLDSKTTRAFTAWSNADSLRAMYAGQAEMHLVEVDPNDPEDVYEKVATALREAERRGLLGTEVVVDCTGGTKLMTVGMALAATTMGRSLQYMKPRAYDAQGRAKPVEGADPLIMDLQYVFGNENE